jgi:hypothetical protein
MFGMGEVSLGFPGLHLGAGPLPGDCAGLELILDPAQAVAGAIDIRFRRPALAIGMKLTARKRGRL